MGAFDDELARRQAIREWEAQMAALRQAQHDFEEAQEGRDRELFEARQRQDRIWQEKLEQSRREDAADAKAAALARQQLWELFVKAVSKPVHVAPLAPDRDLAQVNNLPETSVLCPNRPAQVPQGVVLAAVQIFVLQTRLSVPEDRPRRRSLQNVRIIVPLAPDRDLAQVAPRVHRRLLRQHHRRPRRPPRRQLQRQVDATQGTPAAWYIKPPRAAKTFVMSGKPAHHARKSAPTVS